MKTQKEFDSKINSITNGRWTAYVAAAAATAFAAAPTAEATIHYSGLINQKIGPRDTRTFQLDPAGGSFQAGHLNYVGGSSNFSAGGGAWLYFHGAQSAAVDGVTCTCTDGHTPVRNCASNLNRRDAISVRPFGQASALLAYDSYFNFWYSCGNFQNRGVGFVGFKFNNGAGDQYGWVRVKMLGETFGGHRNMFAVVDYAYGDPGERVFAGQTGANTSAPELESLGGLALGAAGLLGWRRRRQTLAR
jgi:MYXO-CTERM domain-containing protein